MSTSGTTRPNGHGENGLRPRLSKPQHAQVLRALTDEGLIPHINGSIDGFDSGPSSGISTPLPADAPPSSQSISSARQQVRAQNKRRLFPTIEYAARVSHFDRESDHRDFRGFFVLFWIGLAIMVITTMLRNIKDTGYPMRIKIWSLFTENMWQMALSDLAMVSSTALSLSLHRLFRSQNGWLRWHWGAQVFLTLHTLTLLMKMHSYAFYNGHLSSVQRQLLELDNPPPMTTPTSPTYKYPSSGASVRKDEKEKLGEKRDDDDDPIDSLREDLALELTSPLGRVTYPQNLTMRNYLDYLLCPTLCYELEYPRTEKIRWMELTAKVFAVFGCVFLLTLISEEFIVPVMIESATRLEQAEVQPTGNKTFPFFTLQPTSNYLNHLVRSNRLEFSREWNIPVHNFFRRHVYGASRAHVSRLTATVITFVISALGHELIMACITKKDKVVPGKEVT
ncbi:MAG: hypothetical protein M1816_004461 [Peltula sp. TS41687]|nr:MAG: hypothetical protein M1816_004461 [Peltula sp. TS41687]